MKYPTEVLNFLGNLFAPYNKTIVLLKIYLTAHPLCLKEIIAMGPAHFASMFNIFARDRKFLIDSLVNYKGRFFIQKIL
ncbi:hypothetical protein DSO57_1021826 [Entomophthora muscae]|uniref:Uncharacterized protein n=1 Tax=Entomophthora muscae TaxID=34485 RepID=A0ACC2UE47_9FUNG|nr:hypothetical protein DSO57_1021826 [Entomophthora muscae]